MKFGIFDHVERRRDVHLDQQYRERLELVAQADRAGFYCYHVAEHHHSPLSVAPNAAYFSAVAMRTEKLRFGPLVYVLPLYHPIRLLEDICIIDNLSGGRFQIGIGKGAPIGEEFAMWGGDPLETYDRFDEIFKILMLGLTNDFLTFKGKHYQFDGLWMELKPKQKPHPPFWYAGNPVGAGEYGANFIGFGTIESLAQDVSRYNESWQKQAVENDTELPHVKEPLYGHSKRVFLADSDDAAMKRAAAAYEVYRANFVKPLPGGKSRRPEPAIPGATSGMPWKPTFEEALKSEQVLAGTPQTVRRYVERYDNESESNYLVCSFQWGDLTHEEASSSMEMFSSEIMPSFAEAVMQTT